MDIGISNLIIAISGIIVTGILSGVSIWLSNRAIKNNQFNERNKTFIQICVEEREISEKIYNYEQKFNKLKKESEKLELILQADKTLFDFYEKAALLIKEAVLDLELFEEYFNIKIFEVYDNFMESPLFDTYEDRYFMYKNLSKLFNSIGLSIREKTN